MSYVQPVLQPNEMVRVRMIVHWSIFLTDSSALVIGLALLVWHYADQNANLLLLLGAIAFGGIGVVLAIAAWLKRFGTEVAVTGRRVICKPSLVRRHTVGISLDKVESLDVDQSILGRLFDCGTVAIQGTDKSVEPLRDGADPLQFRNAILVR
jgi:hypothetical protein